MKTLRAHGFNQRPRFEQVVGYLERNEPLPPGSAGPQGHLVRHKPLLPARTPTLGPCSTRPCRQFPRKASALPQFRRGRAAAEAGALASNGQGPPSITDRLRSAADGAQAAADLIGAGAAGLAQLDAAEHVRLNVLPRPGPVQPPPQIIVPQETVNATAGGKQLSRRVQLLPLPALTFAPPKKKRSVAVRAQKKENRTSRRGAFHRQGREDWSSPRGLQLLFPALGHVMPDVLTHARHNPLEVGRVVRRSHAPSST